MPRLSSVFCAFGCLVSDLLGDLVRTVHGVALTRAAVRDAYAAMERDGAAWLVQQVGGVAPAFEHLADIRYAGQAFDVATRLDPAVARDGDLDAIAEAFHTEHQRLFSHSHPGTAIEVIALRLRVRGAAPAGGQGRLRGTGRHHRRGDPHGAVRR